MTFNDLKLSAPLLKAVSEAGYETPSPIQASAIPPVLEAVSYTHLTLPTILLV